MPSDPQSILPSPKPKPGDPVIDCSPIAKRLEDLPEGATRGMQTAREGLAAVIAEILANQEEWGEKAGITPADFAEFQDDNDFIAQIDVYLPAALKLVEMLVETRAKYEDRRQRFIHAAATHIERRAKTRADGESLLGR